MDGAFLNEASSIYLAMTASQCCPSPPLSPPAISCRRYDYLTAISLSDRRVEETRAGTIESVRGIAKEARAVIASEALHGPQTLDAFSSALAPAFRA